MAVPIEFSKEGQFIQGEVKFWLSSSIHIMDRLKELDYPAIEKLLVYNELPRHDAIPRSEMEFALGSVIQFEWFKAVKGEVPPRQAATRKTYVDRYLEMVGSANRGETIVGTKAAKGEKKAKKAAKPKVYVITRYSLVGAKMDTEKGKKLLDKETKTHNGVIAQALNRLKEPATFDELYAELDKRAYGSGAKNVEGNVRWHIQDLKSKGFLKSSDAKEEEEVAAAKA